MDNIIEISWNKQPPEDLLVSIGEWLEALGDWQEALDCYLAALKVNENAFIAAYRAGKLCFKNGLYPEAINHLLTNLNGQSHHQDSLYHIACSYYALGDYSQSLHFSRLLHKVNKKHIRSNLILMRSLGALHKWQELSEICSELNKEMQRSKEYDFWCFVAASKLDKHELAVRLQNKTRKKYLEMFRDLIEMKEQDLSTGQCSSEIE